MDTKHIVTIVGGGVASAVVAGLPIVQAFIPPPWNFVASGAITGVMSLWHLYEDPPNAKADEIAPPNRTL